MSGSTSELDSILAAFGNMRVNNTEIMKQAEAAILEYMHNPSCVNSFFAILLHCDTPVVGLLLGCERSTVRWPHCFCDE